MPRLLLPLLFLLFPALAPAQDDSSTDNAIRATTVLHDDGTKTVTVTDPDKKTSEASTYTANDKLIEKIVYTLNDQNQPVTGIVYTKTGVPAFKASYKHDALNRVTEEDDYTMDGQLIRRFTYDFTADGRVGAIHAFDAQGNELHQSQGRPDQHNLPPRVH